MKVWVLIFLLPLLLFFIPKNRTVSVLVVPHHNIVKDKRLEMLHIIAKRQNAPKTVVLLSPDHFSPHQNSISYVDQDWSLKEGTLAFDHRAEQYLSDTYLVDNTLKRDEHGLYNVIADIGEIWKQASIVPVVIGQKVTKQELDILFDAISSLCTQSCVLVASVDFSHYLPADLADIHDKVSIRTLESMDFEQIDKLEVDSWQSLYLAMRQAKVIQTETFSLFSHTNSSRLVGSPDLESTSHIMGWYEHGSRSQKDSSRTFAYALGLHKDRELDSLGERLFFGSDTNSLDLTQPVQVSRHVFLEPVREASRSSIVVTGERTVIRLADDLVIFGTKSGNVSELVFAPMVKTNGKHYLLRGAEKQQWLGNFYREIKDSYGWKKVSSSRYYVE